MPRLASVVRTPSKARLEVASISCESAISLTSPPSSSRSVGHLTASARLPASSALLPRLCTFSPELACWVMRNADRCNRSPNCAIVKVRSMPQPKPVRICPNMRSIHASPCLSGV
eukprot:scaffold39516_cov75-Phaeocystis_antarctica.AAC.4